MSALNLRRGSLCKKTRKHFSYQYSMLCQEKNSTIKLSLGESQSSRESIIVNSLNNIIIRIGKRLSIPTKRETLKSVGLAIVVLNLVCSPQGFYPGILVPSALIQCRQCHKAKIISCMTIALHRSLNIYSPSLFALGCITTTAFARES